METLDSATNKETRLEIDSRFRLIIVAGLRTKQLLHGSKPRIEADPETRRKNTSIALEEIKRGLVSFTNGKCKTQSVDGVGLDSMALKNAGLSTTRGIVDLPVT